VNRPRLAQVVSITLALVMLGALPAAAQAEPRPAWKLSLRSNPTNFAPGATDAKYSLVATNVGGADTSGPITVTDTLPAGVTPLGMGITDHAHSTTSCLPVSGQTVSCTNFGPVHPGEWMLITVRVEVDPLPEGTQLINEVAVSGGNAVEVKASTTTTISSTPPPFDFLSGQSGLGALLSEADGGPATGAGTHPFQLTLDFGFPTIPGKGTAPYFAADGGLRDLQTFLPRGLIVDPSATPVRCTEARLESDTCPDPSQLGTIDVITTVLNVQPQTSPLYNMVPPRGAPAALGFDAAGSSIYVHVIGGLRAGDYALSATTNDILARFANPVFGIRAQLWGDPSSKSHDYSRGTCAYNGGIDNCPTVPTQNTPLLTAPTSCEGAPGLEASADSWGDPGDFHHRGAPFGDLEGNQLGIDGCNQLSFEPTLKARPTTNVADSPTGLSVDLRIPQTNDLNLLGTANLRKAQVTLPEGLVINPSGANGLRGCSSDQIGIDPANGLANGAPPNCPNASKIGTVEVDSPLLAQYDEENRVKRDPEGHPLPEPLFGAVYVATPHDNPFDSLLAIYIAIDDPATGVVVKLAGHVVADPETGRLTTTFANNPQLPFEEFKLEFFGGASAPLRTPASCGGYATTSELTPWSAPESGPPATPADEYAIDHAPGGGACPTSPGELASAPSSFEAGTISPNAGSYSPFQLNLRRNDGSQEFSSLSLTLPPGLLGRLAGTALCPDATLVGAASKSGYEEQASPSCPAASQVGSVDVLAGAGPVPYHARGTAYLAGPYKGGPLSLAIVTPAAAGPYDLGTVVVRSALRVDPETAQITAVSDPIPHILQGIPLDVRSIALSLDKPQFTLNPTSCDPMSFAGQLSLTQGASAALSSPFQVGGCNALAFKPKLAIKLAGQTKRTGHPALSAVATFAPTDANTKRVQVTLPRSEFLDQAHIGTVCTRVQFAASQCPAASIYGEAIATTPLLDQPLSGPVYLRSSSHELPDLVVALHGQVDVVLAGRVDSVKGAIRNTFEATPDAPVSRFVLKMRGGKKGLLINSADLCKLTPSQTRATVEMDGQNGKVHDFKPVVRNACPKARHKKPHRSKGQKHAR
jgi:uncharacterized repeat protein (TIGR01451 family)